MLPRMMGKPATMARKTAPIRVILDRVFVMKSLVACRTDAGDGAVVLAELVGNVHGVVLDRNVEVVERNDQQHVNDEVKSAVVVEHAEESVQRRMRGSIQIDEPEDQAGQAAQRRGKDDGITPVMLTLMGM